MTRQNGHPFGGSGPVDVVGECGETLATTVGRIGTTLEFEAGAINNSYWFWRQSDMAGNGEIVRTFMVCNNVDGELRGHYKGCFYGDGFEDCSEDTITLRPFGNKEDEPVAEGLSLVSEYFGESDGWPAAFSANVRVLDGIAYIARGRDGLRIVDVSDPAAPFEIGALLAESDNFNDLKLADSPDGTRYALIASDARGVLAIDVSDPTAPSLVTAFTPSGDPQHGVHTIFLDTYEGVPAAFIVDGYSPILAVYDITDPAIPIRLATYDKRDTNNAEYHDLFVEDGVVYLNASWDGLLLVDPAAQEPLLAQFESNDYSHSNWVTTAGGRRVSVHGGEGWNAHVQIVDVDPESSTYMQRIGEWQSRAEVSVHNIVAKGDRAYLAHYEDGVRILDISDPTLPRQIAHYNTWSPQLSDGSYLQGTAGIDVHEDEGLLYASDSGRGLVILRLSPQQ